MTTIYKAYELLIATNKDCDILSNSTLVVYNLPDFEADILAEHDTFNKLEWMALRAQGSYILVDVTK